MRVFPFSFTDKWTDIKGKSIPREHKGKRVPSLGQGGDEFLDCIFNWFFTQFHSGSALKIVTVRTRFFGKLKSRVSSWVLREHL